MSSFSFGSMREQSRLDKGLPSRTVGPLRASRVARRQRRGDRRPTSSTAHLLVRSAAPGWRRGCRAGAVPRERLRCRACRCRCSRAAVPAGGPGGRSRRARRARMVRPASSRMASSNSNAPIGWGSVPTNTVRLPSRSARRRTVLTQWSPSGAPTHSAVPIDTSCPSTWRRMPAPGTSSTPVGRLSGVSRSKAARTTAAARTWLDIWSSDAASRRISADDASGAVAISVSAGRPTVRVPVLSKSSTRPLASRSSATPPFTTTPRRALRDKPATNATASTPAPPSPWSRPGTSLRGGPPAARTPRWTPQPS
jgi:hypothetical protein